MSLLFAAIGTPSLKNVCVPTCRQVKSFPSNPWLVELLKIDLQVADHTMHHIDGRVNFGKRLSAWDRLFDTFKPASTLHEQKKNFQ